MKKFIVAGLMVLGFISCTRPEATRELLTTEGYTDIKITGYSFFACSEDDTIQTGFIAVKNGKVVQGTVCEGLLLRGRTIRFHR